MNILLPINRDVNPAFAFFGPLFFNPFPKLYTPDAKLMSSVLLRTTTTFLKFYFGFRVKTWCASLSSFLDHLWQFFFS